MNEEQEKFYFSELLKKLNIILDALFSQNKITVGALEKLVNGFTGEKNPLEGGFTLDSGISSLVEDHYRRSQKEVGQDLSSETHNFSSEVLPESKQDFLFDGFKKKVSTFFTDTDKQVIKEVFFEAKNKEKAVPLFLNSLKTRAGESWNKEVVGAEKQEKVFFSNKIKKLMIEKYKSVTPGLENQGDSAVLEILEDGYQVDALTYNTLLSEACNQSQEEREGAVVKPRLSLNMDSGNNRRFFAVWALDVTYSENFMAEQAQKEIQSW